MKPAYTVIIPHHNIPALLERCLMSIPVRDDVQVIVVDDTSNSENLEKFRVLADRYSDVAEFMYTAEGKGAGMARNLGLGAAKGSKVIFADADDYFLPAFPDILDRYKDSNADLIFFNAIAVDSKTSEPSSRADHLRAMHDVYSFDNEKGLRSLRYLFGEPWCRIVSKELIDRHHIRFEEIPIHNDTTFAYLCGYYANRIIVDNSEGYCLTDRAGSVSKAVSDEKQEIRTRVFSVKNRFLKEHGIDVFDGIIFGGLMSSIKRRNIRKALHHLQIIRRNGVSVPDLVGGYIKTKKQ